jgi:hypothetical protein
MGAFVFVTTNTQKENKKNQKSVPLLVLVRLKFANSLIFNSLSPRVNFILSLARVRVQKKENVLFRRHEDDVGRVRRSYDRVDFQHRV